MNSRKTTDFHHSKSKEILLMILVITWVIGITVVAQLLEWLMEQSLFESTSLFPDMRWLIHIAYTVLLSFPLLITGFITQNQKLKVIFNFWGILSFSGFFLTQGRFTFINQANLVSIFQIIGISIYLILLYVIGIKQKTGYKEFFFKDKESFLYISGFAALLSIPWVIWGALGSFSDTLLNVFAGILLSILIVTTYSNYFIKKISINSESENPGRFINGLVLFVGLVILSTTFGQNGQQWLLVLTLPFSAWLLSDIFNNRFSGQQGPTTFLLAFIIGFPLCWFDPDEMSLLIGTQKGEIFTWINQTILVTIILFLLLTVFNIRIIDRMNISKDRWVWRYSSGVWIFSILLYFFIGQPGFFGESYLLVLNQFDQFDKLHQFNNENKKENIYLTIGNYAMDSQAEIKGILDFWNISYHSYYLVNAIEVKSGPIFRYFLSKNDHVIKTLESPNLRPLPEKNMTVSGTTNVLVSDHWNLESLGVFQIREKYGVTGKGVIIGQADSGVDGQHPQLNEQYLGYRADDNFHWLDPWNLTTEPTDSNGHGTQTLGIILGKDIGIAPDAKWIGCVNLARNFGNPGFYIECLQFLYAPYPQNGNPFLEGRPDQGANIINNSWGCPLIEGCDQELFQSAVKILRESGVFVVAANGNDGYYGCESTISPLAIYDEVLSVGALNKEGELAPFSSLGPASVKGEIHIKPDLIAPGVDIFSAMPNNTYSLMSGTSAAAPHVTGIVALMWSANPDLIGNISLTEELLFSTAKKYDGNLPTCLKDNSNPNNAVGFGIVNAFNAVEAAINLK